MKESILENSEILCHKLLFDDFPFFLFRLHRMEEIYKKALIKAQNVNFSYFINLAMSAKITWTELGNILDDLTPSIEKSKQLNKVLLKEFEVLNSQNIE